MGKTLLVLIREHLLLPGEGFAQMKEMVTKLTDKDKADLKGYFQAQGIEVAEAAEA